MKNIHNLKYYQGFSIIKNINDFKNKIKIKGPFYSNNCCYEISDNDFHHLHIDDITEDLSQYKKTNNVCRSYPSLLERNELKWINTFQEWLSYYFIYNIKDIIGNDEISNNVITINLKDIKNFNSSKFNLLKFGHETGKNRIVVYINTVILNDIFGFEIYNNLNKIFEKYNITFKNLTFIINFEK